VSLSLPTFCCPGAKTHTAFTFPEVRGLLIAMYSDPNVVAFFNFRRESRKSCLRRLQQLPFLERLKTPLASTTEARCAMAWRSASIVASYIHKISRSRLTMNPAVCFAYCDRLLACCSFSCHHVASSQRNGSPDAWLRLLSRSCTATGVYPPLASVRPILFLL